MTTAIHCHFCGGVVHNPTKIQYQPPRASAQLALPHEGLCTCKPPIVYQDPPGLEPRGDKPTKKR